MRGAQTRQQQCCHNAGHYFKEKECMFPFVKRMPFFFYACVIPFFLSGTSGSFCKFKFSIFFFFFFKFNFYLSIYSFPTTPPTSVLNMTLNYLMVRFQWLTSLPGSLWPGVVVPDKLCTYAKLKGLNRTVLIFNCVWTKNILILNWNVWIRTAGLYWIAWNGNVFDIETVLMLNWIV